MAMIIGIGVLKQPIGATQLMPLGFFPLYPLRSCLLKHSIIRHEAGRVGSGVAGRDTERQERGQGRRASGT